MHDALMSTGIWWVKWVTVPIVIGLIVFELLRLYAKR